MMETGENLSLPENEDHDTKKYKKHVNDLIEDAEIEAEMEAEKKIRSKNSRVLLISIFCFGLLSLVYLQINSRTTQVAVPGEEKTAHINTQTKSAEEKLIKQVSINNFIGPAKTTPAKISNLSRGPRVTAKFEKKIAKTNQHDYWGLRPHLKKETQNYIPLFIAVNYAMNYYKKLSKCRF